MRFEMNIENIVGGENILAAIRDSIDSLEPFSTYYHFVGHPDERWNEEGFSGVARDKIVPIKVSKGLKTIGIYYPAEWILDKFGGHKAKEEFRCFKLLPPELSIPLRFYVFSDRVLHINDHVTTFNGILVEDEKYAGVHRDFILRLFELL
jgi:hypothetical protein